MFQDDVPSFIAVCRAFIFLILKFIVDGRC
jgi:hypothetical protein